MTDRLVSAESRGNPQGMSSDNPARMQSPPPAPPELMLLLRGVSRSFYLSIRLLPAPLRAPVAAGYLLARAADTIADSAVLPARARRAELAELAQRVQQPPGTTQLDAVTALGQRLAWCQADGEERRLLLQLPACFGLLHALPPDDQEDVRTVLAHITRGQQLDVERFGAATAAQPVALADASEVDEYTWLVAGCVGEFWTRVCERHLTGFSLLPTERMLALGRSHGQALQLVNILRDERSDLAQGRRYLPADMPRERWIAKAREGLRDGMAYALALRSRRVRVASALPAILGARTLALLQAAPRGEPVKVPRSEVRALLLRCAFSFGSRAVLRRAFDRADRWDNAAP